MTRELQLCPATTPKFVTQPLLSNVKRPAANEPKAIYRLFHSSSENLQWTPVMAAQGSEHDCVKVVQPNYIVNVMPVKIWFHWIKSVLLHSISEIRNQRLMVSYVITSDHHTIQSSKHLYRISWIRSEENYFLIMLLSVHSFRNLHCKCP